MTSLIRRQLSLAGLVSLLAAPGAAAQTFEGILTTRVAGMPAGAAMKTYFSKGKLRMEVTNPGRPSVVMITDPAANKQYTLMPEQGVYMAMDLKDLGDAAAAAAGKTPTTSSTATLKATGRKETVAGVSCEHYAFEDATQKMDLCLTSALGKMPGGAGMFGTPQPGKGQETPAWAKELAKKNAFAVKVADGTGKVIWEVTGIERKELAPTLFSPPAGYREFKMPGTRSPIKPPGNG
jgi:hypothetical protein